MLLSGKLVGLVSWFVWRGCKGGLESVILVIVIIIVIWIIL
jgi:hypothetical protein